MIFVSHKTFPPSFASDEDVHDEYDEIVEDTEIEPEPDSPGEYEPEPMAEYIKKNINNHEKLHVYISKYNKEQQIRNN